MHPPPAPTPRPWRDRFRAMLAGPSGERRLVRLQWEGKVAMAVVLAMAGGAAAAMAMALPHWPWPGAVVWWTGLLWGLAVATAACLPVWGFAMASLWLGWQSVALVGPWVGTPLVALPAGWLLLVALSTWAWDRRGRSPAGITGWLAMALGMGWLLGEPTGWNDLLGLEARQGWAGQGLLGMGLAVGGIKLRPWWKSRAWTRPGWGKVALGSLLVMGLGLGFSLGRDATAAAGWAAGEVPLAGGWVSLMWFWLGGAAGVVLVSGADCLTRQGVRGITLGPARQGMPLLWLVVTVIEWLASHAEPGGLLARAVRSWVSDWPAWAREVMAAHAWVGVATVVLGAGFLYQGRDTVRLLLRLNAVWLGAFGALLAVGPVLASGAEGAVPMACRPGGAILLVLGMAWLVRQHWQDVPWGAAAGPAGGWGGMAVLAGLITAHVIHEQPSGTWRAGPAAVLGLVHLVLPVMFYRWWVRGRKGTVPLPLTIQAGMVLAGIAGVLPVLQSGTASVALLGWEPLWWTGVLWALRRQRPQLQTAEGALAGGLLGVSAVAAWCRPDLLLPLVPMVPWLNVPDAVLLGGSRPWLEPLHLVLVLMLGASGAALGALIFRGGAAPGLNLMPLLVDGDAPSPSAQRST